MGTSSFLPVFLSLMVAIGIMITTLTFYISSLLRNFKNSSNKFFNRINDVVTESVQKNELLSKERLAIERQLRFVTIKLKGEPITFKAFVKLSFACCFIGLVFALVTTTKNGYFNPPAVLVVSAIGLIAPRWYLFVVDGNMRHSMVKEAPQALVTITDSSRYHANIERAVLESINELPKTTKKRFTQAIEQQHYGEHKTTFAALMYDMARHTKNQIWLDFAHVCLVDTTLGSADRLASLRTLLKQSRKALTASKEERKSLNAKVLKAVIAYVFLTAILLTQTYLLPQYGQYLYSTAIGRLLILAVYITFSFNVALFTWLYYNA